MKKKQLESIFILRIWCPVLTVVVVSQVLTWYVSCTCPIYSCAYFRTCARTYFILCTQSSTRQSSWQDTWYPCTTLLACCTGRTFTCLHILLALDVQICPSGFVCRSRRLASSQNYGLVRGALYHVMYHVFNVFFLPSATPCVAETRKPQYPQLAYRQLYCVDYSNADALFTGHLVCFVSRIGVRSADGHSCSTWSYRVSQVQH